MIEILLNIKVSFVEICPKLTQKFDFISSDQENFSISHKSLHLNWYLCPSLFNISVKKYQKQFFAPISQPSTPNPLQTILNTKNNFVVLFKSKKEQNSPLLMFYNISLVKKSYNSLYNFFFKKHFPRHLISKREWNRINVHCILQPAFYLLFVFSKENEIIKNKKTERKFINNYLKLTIV